MGSRYGRNQRRRHREEISRLEATLAGTLRGYSIALKLQRDELDAKLKTARVDALNAYLQNHPELNDMIRGLVEEVARLVAPEVERLAKQIMESGIRRDKFERPLELSVRAVPGRPDKTLFRAETPDMEAVVHHVKIPAMAWNRIV